MNVRIHFLTASVLGCAVLLGCSGAGSEADDRHDAETGDALLVDVGLSRAEIRAEPVQAHGNFVVFDNPFGDGSANPAAAISGHVVSVRTPAGTTCVSLHTSTASSHRAHSTASFEICAYLTRRVSAASNERGRALRASA